ncbi:MAG: F0F1 ATP synthase subunit gamma [Rhizobiales bacterium]|nr:F0F1 ATP synthase subunit gamma [Hyphomicrobiales bacterium]
MASLKDLRNRIASVKATQKITKAMQMVAAAKLRRAQDAAVAARPYAERMDRVLANLGARVAESATASPILVGTGKDHTHLLVVATADRGLCGGFNTNIVKLARAHIGRLVRDGKQVKIFCVGKKGYDSLRRDYANLIVERVDFTGRKHVDFELADKIGARVREMFAAGAFDICTLFFSEFESIISQKPTPLQLIPARLPVVADAGKPASSGAAADNEYEPSEEEILEDLLPRNVSTQVFRALLENAASEQGARMSAMDNATRNAGDMIGRLTLQYNRTRQAKITTELIEIISGAEAL